MTAVGLDWDEWNDRRVDAIATLDPFCPIDFKPPAPQGLSGASSISSVERNSPLAPLKPKLAPPVAVCGKSYLLDIIDLHNEAEEITTAIIDHTSEQIRSDMALLDKFSNERAAALEQHAREIAARETWGVWATIAQYITTAASVVLGIGLLSNPATATAGGFLIASGGLGLGNRVLNDLGVWNVIPTYFTESVETQQKVARWIDTGMYFLSVGLGLAGGIMAYQAGAFATASKDEIAQKVGQIMGIAGTVMGAATRFGGALADRRALRLQADLKLIDAKNFSLRQEVNDQTADIKKAIEMNTRIGEDVRNVIISSEVSFD